MDCVIIASGDLKFTPEIRRIIESADLIVCADGGARHLRQIDMMPHVLIGDFDSIRQTDKAFFKENNVRMIQFPEKKDQTDSELCLLWAMEQQVSRITLLGGIGTRMDHSLANIFLLKQLADQKIPARIINANNEIYMVWDFIEIEGTKGDLLSIIPVTETVSGITLTGLEYSLTNGELNMGTSMGVSNRFLDTLATVSVKNGGLIATKSRD